MIHKAHNSECSGDWPPDSNFPVPEVDLEALFQAVKTAWDTYLEAARVWEASKEKLRLAAWKAYHEQAGWPRDVDYKAKLEAKLAAYEPKVVEKPIVEPIIEG